MTVLTDSTEYQPVEDEHAPRNHGNEQGLEGPTILVLAHNTAGVFQQSVIQGASEVASKHHLELRIMEVAGKPEWAAIAAAKEASCTLVLSNALSDMALTSLHSAGTPLTLVSHRATELDLAIVMHDNRQGISQLMSYLISECRRRKPLFIRGDQTQLDAQEREQAFRDELMRHSLTVPEQNFIVGSFEPDTASASLTDFLTANDDFDSIVASDYLMAIAAMQVLRGAGRAVPEAVAVVGFGDGPEAQTNGLTTVAADVVELGRRAAQQLVAQLPGKRPGGPIRGRTLLSTHLVRRASSGQPRERQTK